MERASIALVTAAAVPSTAAAVAQTAREAHGPAAVVPLAEQPPARIIVDPPLAEPLSHERIVVQYRTENLRIVPVFGPDALDVSPRVGHGHVSVDDASWRWLDASGEPLTVNGLAPGQHKILIQLVDANHRPLDQAVVDFVIPEEPPPARHGVEGRPEHDPPT